MNKAKLESLLVEGLNLQRKMQPIKDMIHLSEARSSYILWRKKLQDYCAQDPALFIKISEVFEFEEVMKTIDRGCGIDLSDPFAQTLIKNIETEIKNKLIFIRNLSKDIFTNPKNTLFSKDDSGNYFYKGIYPIELPPRTLYADFFKVLFTFHEPDGFISDEKIIEHLKSIGYTLAKSSLKNAMDNFFQTVKINGTTVDNKTYNGEPIIRRVRGKGFMFYNPKVI